MFSPKLAIHLVAKHHCGILESLRTCWQARDGRTVYTCAHCQHPTEYNALRELWDAGPTGEYICPSCMYDHQEARQAALEETMLLEAKYRTV